MIFKYWYDISCAKSLSFETNKYSLIKVRKRTITDNDQNVIKINKHISINRLSNIGVI